MEIGDWVRLRIGTHELVGRLSRLHTNACSIEWDTRQWLPEFPFEESIQIATTIDMENVTPYTPTYEEELAWLEAKLSV